MFLRYSTGVPSCWRLDRAEVVYRPDSIEISLYLGFIPPPRFCEAIALERGLRLSLHEPVDDRRLVDGFVKPEAVTRSPTP